jgi:hypothetical protein
MTLPQSDESKSSIQGLKWCMKMRDLADKAIKVAGSGEFEIIPEMAEKSPSMWMEDVNDLILLTTDIGQGFKYMIGRFKMMTSTSRGQLGKRTHVRYPTSLI